MVKMVCIDCGTIEHEAESLREMLVMMMPHYFEAHQDVIASHKTNPSSAWMKRFTAAFNQLLEQK